MECRLRNFYKKWITIGRIPEHGLCNSMPTIELGDILFLFKPEKDQIDHGYPRAYWGCEFPFKDIEDVYMMHGFTPLRQIIVLLMCEMIEDDTYIFPPLRSR